MPTVAEGLQSQIRNIEATYGRPIDDWVELIRATPLRRHGEIVACTHRVRVLRVDDVDPELIGWLQEAYAAAG